MRRRIALALLLLVSSGVAPAAGSPSGSSPTIVGVYPNPAADGDAGEYVLIEHPPRESGWTITDGESNRSLPPASARRARYSDQPAVIRQRRPTERPPDTSASGSTANTTVQGLDGSLSLSNAGETIRLQRRGETVQTVSYAKAPEGERYERTAAGWTWRSPGATDFPIQSFETAAVTAFALPDAPGPPMATLENASRRIWLAGYTFTHNETADVLIEAHRAGRSVRVLLEGGPVGGVSARQRRQLDRLVAAGVDVRLIAGPLTRYRYHHPKYAVVDDRAIVTSENWKAAGIGGNSSRGWGVIVEPPATGSSAGEALARVFTADRGWRDAIPWRDHRTTLSPAPTTPPEANATYPTRHPAETSPAAAVELLLAPDNTRAGVIELLQSAEETIAIEQPTLGSPEGPFVRAALDAAERGVEVRVLLDRSWYVREDNQALVAELNRIAEQRSIPLRAKLVEPRGRFEKIHAKGVVVDGERTLVGSLNWNDNARTANREVSVIVHSEGVARYFTRVFDADWNAAERVPIGFTGIAGGALLAVVIALAWGLSFQREGPR